jgi:hypothetical protein
MTCGECKYFASNGDHPRRIGFCHWRSSPEGIHASLKTLPPSFQKVLSIPLHMEANDGRSCPMFAALIEIKD